MKTRKLFLLTSCVFIFASYPHIMYAQKGVFLPQGQGHTHVHADGTVCSSDHHRDAGVSDAAPSQKVTSTEITLRRSTRPGDRDLIYGPANVDSVFGAGESAAISSQYVTWPAKDASHNLDVIHIGSQFAKNAVISIYDNDGQASGKLRQIRFYDENNMLVNNGNNPPPNDHNVIWSNGQNGGNGDAGAVSVIIPEIYYLASKDAFLVNNYGYIPNPITGGTHMDTVNAIRKEVTKDNVNITNFNHRPDTLFYNSWMNPNINNQGYLVSAFWPYKDPHSDTIFVTLHNHTSYQWSMPWNGFYFTSSKPQTVYTSTRDNTDNLDNGKSLIHTISGKGTPSHYENELNNMKYIRPTTVLLSDTNYFQEIKIGDIEWYASFDSARYIKTDSVWPFKAFDDNGNCGHFSGYVSYLRDSVAFDTFKIVSSGRYVDAAIRLLDNSDVYVKRNIEDISRKYLSINTDDSTGTVAGPNTNGSDVLLVLPGKPNSQGQMSNFRLKTGGDAKILHTQDSNYYAVNNPLTDGFLYRSSISLSGLGSPFPTAQTPVFLPGNGTNRYREADVMRDYRHPRESLTLTDKTSFSDSAMWMPYGATMASVYGVQGLYEGNTAIHTRTIFGNDTTNIIEIGRITNNQDFFKIYSSGMLKNFRSGTDAGDTLVIGNLSDRKSPGFFLSNDSMPLYIINDGNGVANDICCAGAIKFNAPGIDSINAAIAHAGGGGDLHIQANGFVGFYGGSPDFTLTKQNEIKILSDHAYINASENITFANGDSAHFTLWARGKASASRGIFTGACPDGGDVNIGGKFTAKYNPAGPKSNGLVLIRSDNDDVLVGNVFKFENTPALPASGELMLQAGQDIRLADSVILTWNGPRSILLEAKKTARFGNGFVATSGNGIMTNGDLTIKAGYPTFFPTADVVSPLNWTLPDAAAADSYANREANQPAATTGGDIWFDGNAEITLTPLLSDSVDTYIRAFNSIYLGGKFNYSLTSAYTSGSNIVDTILLYAETGNVEAISNNGDTVRFNIGRNDSTYLLIQAGNTLGNPCGQTQYFADNRWDGNILFGSGRVFAINHKGVGPTLISAARDIENQAGANFNFTYENTNLAAGGDNLKITAGRHIETHAPYLFDFIVAGTGITDNIMMQAGHQSANCNYLLCKTVESASNPTYNASPDDNTFAQGGSGHGSILAFDSITFNYNGRGEILLTALNGNIESDPYLHKTAKNNAGYDAANNIHNAQFTFNHGGTGV
ncbi:MAG: hypothetical protein LBD80_04565, partial [Tannerella sp.]|nr:hypothetical protein [Tannerella sp.]